MHTNYRIISTYYTDIIPQHNLNEKVHSCFKNSMPNYFYSPQKVRSWQPPTSSLVKPLSKIKICTRTY